MAFDAVNAALILSKGVGCPPNDMQSFNATSQEDGIKITFTGPKNSYVFGAVNNDTLLSTPAGVMIRYSDTDYPADINDGTLLGVYNENYNPVNPTEVTDNLIGLVFEQTYYFSAFPFSVDGIYNKSQAPANRASCQWVGNKGTINVTVATYEGYAGEPIGDYTITLVDQASSDPQNVIREANGTGMTQIGNLEEGKTYVVTLTDVNDLTCDPSEPITISAGETYNVTMTYREKYGTISVTVTTANDAFALGEYKITLLDQASESSQNIEKQATGKTTTVFENLIAGKQYKVRLGPATNWIAPVDSDTLTVLGGDDVAITMTYAAGMGSVVINVSTNPAGMPIGIYTISLVPQGGGSTLQQSGSESQAVTFNNVPIGTYNVKGSSISHYTFSGGEVSVTGGQQSSHDVVYALQGISTFANTPWDVISVVSRGGKAADYWSVGDTKTVHVNSGLATGNKAYDFTMRIVGFVNGITLCSDEVVPPFDIDENREYYSNGAHSTFNDTLYYQIESSCRENIRSVTKTISGSVRSVEVFALAASEIYNDGEISFRVYNEGSKLPYFTTNAQRRKKLVSSPNGKYVDWSTRSTLSGGSYGDYNFLVVTPSGGAASGSYSTFSSAIAFCI